MAADTTKKHFIRIRGANVNNLKNLSVDIPRDKFVVFTGLSGSGKSSLAFDTIYAEGQRRYMESLSSYARQFLGQMEKPDVESIEGLSPAISIDQKSTNRNPRSTVGTVTEIYDYMRLLYARIGIPHCPKCGKEIRQQTIDQIIDQILALPEGTRIQVLAPVVRGRKGEHAKVLEDARRSGYVRVRADGNLYDLSEDIPLEKEQETPHRDRGGPAHRPARSWPAADGLRGDGVPPLRRHRHRESAAGGAGSGLSQNYACDDCGISIEELTPGCSPSTTPTAPAPPARGLGACELKADPTSSSPTTASPFWTEPSRQRLELHPLRRHQPDVLRGPVQEISVLPPNPGAGAAGVRAADHPLRHRRREAGAAL